MRDCIAARISGVDYTCRIHRGDLAYFEALHGPIQAVFDRVRDGRWTINQLLSVLDFAVGPRPSHTDAPEVFAMHRELDAKLRRGPSEDGAKVAQALNANGPGIYVPLVLGVLAACIWGVEDAEAHFSDQANA